MTIYPNLQVLDLPMKFSLEDLAYSNENFRDINVCIKLDSPETGDIILKETCLTFTSEAITLSNVKAGNYLLTSVTTGKSLSGEEAFGPMKQVKFTVQDFAATLPKLTITNKDFIFLTDEQNSNLASVEINFDIQPSTIPLTNFNICGQLLLGVSRNDEIQKLARPKEQSRYSAFKKVNPLKNLAARIKLNPYVEVRKNDEARQKEAQKKAKESKKRPADATTRQEKKKYIQSILN